MQIRGDLMSEWISVPDYQDMIGTECIGCGKAISLGRSYSGLVPRLCEECKEAIKFAKKLMNDQINNKNDQIDLKKELVDDFEKHLHECENGILYHHYCVKCGWDWWTDEAFPNRCSKCGCELK